MAEVRCPMCPKMNLEELESCQHCGARLKPLTAPLDPIKPGEIPTPKNTGELERTLPGWLRDAREEAAGGDTFTPDEDSADTPGFNFDLPGDTENDHSPLDSSSDLPDFLKHTPDQPAQSDEPQDLLAGLMQTASSDDDSLPDWMAGLQSDLPAAPVTNEPTSLEPASEETDPINWDGFTEQSAEQQQPEADPFGEPEPLESPDWLQALKSEQEAPIQQPSHPEPDTPVIGGQGDAPDWLADLSNDSSASLPQAMAETPQVQPAQADDSPDWLASLGQDDPLAGSPEPAPVTTDMSQSGGETDLPDWLSGLQDESATPSAAVEETPDLAAGDNTDWLMSLGDQPAETPAPAPETSDDSMPDWLSGLQEESPATTVGTPAPSTEGAGLMLEPSETTPLAIGDAQEGMPDWLAGLQDEPATPASSQDETLQSAKPFGTGTLGTGTLSSEEETPDWLAGVGPAATAAGAAMASDSFPAEPEAQSVQESPAESEPAWLPSAETTGDTPGEPAPADAGSLNWLKDFSSEPAAEENLSLPDFDSADPAQAGSEEALPMGEMPDWLSSFTPQEAQAQANEQPASGDDISPGSLPSWVQAMRPVESAMSQSGLDDEEGVVEQQGPLAGLQNVLPVRQGMLAVQKPRAYSIKLQADETQQAQSALLDELITMENEPQPVPPRDAATSVLRPLRLGVAAVLVLVTLLAALFGGMSMPAPALGDDAVLFLNSVNALPEAASVLLVFDYQPGSAGEMENLAAPIANHLLARNANLSVVSTSPTGSLMARRVLAGALYNDLGYLPGGPSGIVVFADRSLAGFSAVIVLSDSPDDARLWVEQAGPKLVDQSMLMAVSAQAEPMIRPYFDSRQIQGLLTGLSGGLAYETANQRVGRARQYWDTYAVALMISELMIVVGAAWAILSNLQARRANRQQEIEE